MKKIPVVWLSYHQDEGISNRKYWDMGMFESIFSKELWNPVGSYDFEHFEAIDESMQGAVIMIPARHHASDVERINEDIAKLDFCVAVLGGDEESSFPIEQLKHPRMSIWVMQAVPGRHDAYHKFGSGWPPQIKQIKHELSDKPNDWFFAGQVNHDRRRACVKVLDEIPGGEVIKTEGFTQGISHEEYYKKMNDAKIIPAPSGIRSPDSFRLFEALELGCIPLADAKPPVDGYPDHYWENLFGQDELPFPVISDWDSMSHMIKVLREGWPGNANKTFAWWQMQKRKMAYELHDDVFRFVGERPEPDLKDRISVLIPTSPIKSHPSLHIIEQTLTSIRERLPDCEIIIMCDGVHAEREYLRPQYDEYLRRLLWKCNHEWHNVVPIIFDEHSHQATMARKTLPYVKTPNVLYCEGDCQLKNDIPFANIASALENNHFDMVRFHHETEIGDYHKHLMLDEKPIEVEGTTFIRTVQWSNRPYMVNTDYFRRAIDKYFPLDAVSMIEDVMHSAAQSEPWDNNRLAIYAHDGDMQHSTTLDGNDGDVKPKLYLGNGRWLE